jgi:hypothetical protein
MEKTGEIDGIIGITTITDITTSTIIIIVIIIVILSTTTTTSTTTLFPSLLHSVGTQAREGIAI